MSEGARACGSETEERWPSSVSHSAGARGGETMEAALHVIGLGWAPVHMGNAQCLVCFKRLQCWKPSLSFLSLSVVSWEMWKWFYRWTSLRFFWEGWLLPSPFPFSFPMSASPSISPSSDNIVTLFFSDPEGSLQLRSGTFCRGWSEAIDSRKAIWSRDLGLNQIWRVEIRGVLMKVFLRTSLRWHHVDHKAFSFNSKFTQCGNHPLCSTGTPCQSASPGLLGWWTIPYIMSKAYLSKM